MKNKPVLKVTKKTVFEVDDRTFDKFVQEVYNCPDYNFVPTEECGNDSQHTFKPTGKIHEYNKELMKQIKDGKIPIYGTSLLFEALLDDGYIEPGEYLVTVCW